MARQITLYTQDDSLSRYVRKNLFGTGVEVIVDLTHQWKFGAPIFIAIDGTKYYGFRPLDNYIAKLRAGEENPVVPNPIGDAMGGIARLTRRDGVFDDPTWFGNNFNR